MADEVEGAQSEEVAKAEMKEAVAAVVAMVVEDEMGEARSYIKYHRMGRCRRDIQLLSHDQPLASSDGTRRR